MSDSNRLQIICLTSGGEAHQPGLISLISENIGNGSIPYSLITGFSLGEQIELHQLEIGISITATLCC